jgi:ATP-dependent Clp protease adaptor protein ClpS
MSQRTSVGTVELEPEVVERPDADRKPRQIPRYHVVLWDDQDHTHAYVMVMMQKVFGYPLTRGFQIADEVDRRGRAVVITTTREHAELKRDQIHSFGKDGLIEACKGSMSASIEPAP